MAAKHPALGVVVATYRIPTRAVFNKNRVDKNSTWDDVYGNKRCSECHKLLEEGDAYRTEKIGRKVRHVECPEKVKK